MKKRVHCPVCNAILDQPAPVPIGNDQFLEWYPCDDCMVVMPTEVIVVPSMRGIVRQWQFESLAHYTPVMPKAGKIDLSKIKSNDQAWIQREVKAQIREISRLKGDFIRGHRRGKRYSAPQTEVARLRRLYNRLRHRRVCVWEHWFQEADPGERLYSILKGQKSDDCDCDEADDFWASIADSQPSNPDYVRGFAEAMLGF